MHPRSLFTSILLCIPSFINQTTSFTHILSFLHHDCPSYQACLLQWHITVTVGGDCRFLRHSIYISAASFIIIIYYRYVCRLRLNMNAPSMVCRLFLLLSTDRSVLAVYVASFHLYIFNFIALLTYICCHSVDTSHLSIYLGLQRLQFIPDGNERLRRKYDASM